MRQTRIVPLFLAMLAVHFAHVLEEGWEVWFMILVWGAFGHPLFYIVNWILYCLVLILLYYVLVERKWAYTVSVVYATFMGVQGTAHTALALATGSIFNGFDGLVTGLPLLAVSAPLVYYLVKEIRGMARTQGREK